MDELGVPLFKETPNFRLVNDYNSATDHYRHTSVKIAVKNHDDNALGMCHYHDGHV